jgi:HAD superfamily hydrolase (TIGR01509 family)
VFDLGGVVVNYKNEYYFEYLSRICGRSKTEIDFILTPMIFRFETGAIGEGRFELEVSKALSIKRSNVGWVDFYKQKSTINKGVLELIKELHKWYTTAFLSNVDKSRYLLTMRRIDTSIFDYRFGSCYLNLYKPHAAIYKFVLTRMGFRPEETVFIDDRKDNVYGARCVGMHAIRFTGLKDVRTRINALIGR